MLDRKECLNKITKEQIDVIETSLNRNKVKTKLEFGFQPTEETERMLSAKGFYFETYHGVEKFVIDLNKEKDQERK